MRSTRIDGEYAPYVGVDLTDRYAGKIRPIDVCGLHGIGNGQFRAQFYEWIWNGAVDWKHPDPLDVESILVELRAATCSMLDGPQGLAKPSRPLRECERFSVAAGRTPWHRPEKMIADRGIRRPFAGFVNSALDLFQSLHDAGLSLSPEGFRGGVNEFYPGAKQSWRRLAGRRLNGKSTVEGRRERQCICEVLGVKFRAGHLPTHDENDACLGAVLAAAADRQIDGLILESIGDPLSVDGGILREGPMACPLVVDATLRNRLDLAMAKSFQHTPRRI